ncbi:hypothetical protein BK720_15660 [Bacillus thuringiensis serovar brasilensis]|nr:hypothetical protein BK720_15660 [Bacillus thuringiensis serovar brasilensis]
MDTGTRGVRLFIEFFYKNNRISN